MRERRILVLAPHTDDGELGCGATITKYIERGDAIYYAAFSTAAESLPPEFPPDQLKREVEQATKILNILQENLFVFDYEVRKLNYSRQKILEDLVKLNKILDPDIVFLPSRQDFHQDHITITNEGVRAFKHCSIFGYELIWNNLSLDTDCFITIEERHLDKKIQAISAYKTQADKPYMNADFITSLARVRGMQAGVELAESFEVIRLIMDRL